MSDIRSLTILGSTGTIGVNTLDVVDRHPDRYRVFALTANKGVEPLFRQCFRYRPEYAVMADAGSARQLHEKLQREGLAGIEVLSGIEGLETVAGHEKVDCVMAAIVGAAGLLPTLAAARAGKRILLANKEALVMSGRLFMDTVRQNKAILLPIDSEHNAIWQCMPFLCHDDHGRGNDQSLQQLGVNRILLTASGGPFLNMPAEELALVTPDQACAHPNWKMGRKISVDSATMMNKGLEVIEACWLFETTADNIQVVLHPQSVIHSMVSYVDGSVLAQLGAPDMRTPIAHALAWPDRIESGVEPLDIFAVAELNLQKPDFVRFPCLRFAYEAAQRGGTASTILNAANEAAVDGFLSGRIAYTDIASVVGDTLDNIEIHEADRLEVILDDDAKGRDYANERINALQ